MRLVSDGERRADSRPSGGSSAAPRRRGGIRDTPLDQPSGSGVGTLDHDRGGFGADMWRGTPLRVVLDVLPRLPVALKSDVRRELTQRLLLSTAQPPQGGTEAVSLLGLRLELLYAMGAVEDVIALAAAARPKPGDGLAARAVLSARMLSAATRPRCDTLESAMKRAAAKLVERALIACYALAGDHFRALGAVKLMAEQGTEVTARFRTLVSAQEDPALLRARGAAPLDLDKLDAVEIALLASGRLQLPKGIAKLRHPAYLRAVALSSARPAGRRIAAAEAAFRLGAIDAAELGKAYGALKFRAAVLAGAARISLNRYRPKTRALMYQAARAAGSAGARLVVLANWWRLARASGDWAFAAGVTAPLITKVRPARRWLSHAPHIARVRLAQGRFGAARRWYQVMRRAPFRDQRAFLSLKVLMHLARPGDVTLDRGDLAAWVRQQRREAPGEARRRTVLLRALVQGIADGDANKAVWSAMVGPADAATSAPAVWRGVRGIARERKVGEAVMLILVNLGNRDLGAIPPADLREALRALRDVGLDAEARRLAVEAALAAGF